MKRRCVGILWMVFYLFLFIFDGCALKPVTKEVEHPLIYRGGPVAILVLPPMNRTFDVEVKELYAATIAEPLSLCGYYVLPIEVTSDILKMEGVYDTELLLNTSPQKFKTYFGADAVLYTTIDHWNVMDMMVAATVEGKPVYHSFFLMDIQFMLKSTSSGKTLWKCHREVEIDMDKRMSFLAQVIFAILMDDREVFRTKYFIDYAMEANQIALETLLDGKYHPIYGMDRNAEFVDKKKIEK